MVGFDALQADEHIKTLIRDKKVGGVILFRRNVHTPAQVSALCRELQEINAEVSDTPLLISIDQEGGMVMRIEQGVTPIPAAMAFQAAGSPADCERMNQISGDEMRQVGINMLLAPVLDVNNNRNNPVIGVRAYGEDADTVIEYGMAAMRGQRASGLAVTAKHFPGHGDTAIDTHYAMALVPHDKERLRAVELAPFRAAIAGGVDAIMTAHVVFPAFEADTSVPATLSKGVLTDLLRGEMDYQGVVITDCLEWQPSPTASAFPRAPSPPCRRARISSSSRTARRSRRPPSTPSSPPWKAARSPWSASTRPLPAWLNSSATAPCATGARALSRRRR